MIRINILTESAPREEFLFQLDRGKFPAEKFDIRENSDEDIEWDLLVVYEGFMAERKHRVKKGGLIFFTGEPPMSRVHPKGFRAQFDSLVTQHPGYDGHRDNRHHHPSMNWHLLFSFKEDRYLLDYNQLRDMPVPTKSKTISMITSSKRMMPGHGQRMNFVEALRKRYGGKIDLYGAGIKFVDTKWEAMGDYKFTIAIENSSIPDYWTEKFADPVLAYTVPIYCGCTNIGDYFDQKAFVPLDITDRDAAFATIDKILADPEAAYNEHLEALKAARKQIMGEYNFFSEVWRMFGDVARSNADYRDVTLRPSRSFWTFKPLFYILRVKRLAWKIWLKMKSKL